MCTFSLYYFSVHSVNPGRAWYPFLFIASESVHVVSLQAQKPMGRSAPASRAIATKTTTPGIILENDLVPLHFLYIKIAHQRIFGRHVSLWETKASNTSLCVFQSRQSMRPGTSVSGLCPLSRSSSHGWILLWRWGRSAQRISGKICERMWNTDKDEWVKENTNPFHCNETSIFSLLIQILHNKVQREGWVGTLGVQGQHPEEDAGRHPVCWRHVRVLCQNLSGRQSWKVECLRLSENPWVRYAHVADACWELLIEYHCGGSNVGKVMWSESRGIARESQIPAFF